jgi:hypothetical protein
MFLEILSEHANIIPVPTVDFTFPETLSHKNVLQQMSSTLSTSNAILTLNTKATPEGIVVRTADRSFIAKLRFDDYVKALMKTR